MDTYPKASAKLRKAFDAFQKKAREDNRKPMQEDDKQKGIHSRLTLFAILETLTKIPASLIEPQAWLEDNDKKKATARYQSANDAITKGETWAVRILVDDFCTFRSANPRKTNTLGEGVKSYYSLEMNDGKHFITIPDRNSGDYAIVVRVN